MEFLRALPFEKKLMALNGLLLAATAAAAVYLVVRERDVPAAPPIDLIRDELGRIAATASEPDEARVDEAYPLFGAVPAFDTLIPMPTPTPTPTPTPVPPPNLAEAVQHLRFTGMGAGLLFFQDRRANEDFAIDMEQDGWRNQQVEHRGEVVRYRIESVDSMQFTVTLVYDEKGPRQEVVKGAFDED